MDGYAYMYILLMYNITRVVVLLTRIIVLVSRVVVEPLGLPSRTTTLLIQPILYANFMLYRLIKLYFDI